MSVQIGWLWFGTTRTNDDSPITLARALAADSREEHAGEDDERPHTYHATSLTVDGAVPSGQADRDLPCGEDHHRMRCTFADTPRARGTTDFGQPHSDYCACRP